MGDASRSTDAPPHDPGDPTTTLNGAETGTLAALVEGLFPRDELGPGAVDIGVVDYLRQAFLGPYRDLIPIYRQALAGLNAVAAREYGQGFSELASAPRDAIIRRLERGEIEELLHTDAAHFFRIVWQHLREGLFGDPIHGGNRDMLGWRLIGFPGAQYGYSEADQQLDAPINREPRSVADLRADPREPREP